MGKGFFFIILIEKPIKGGEAGPGRFGRQVSVTGIYHTIPCREVVAWARYGFFSKLIDCLPRQRTELKVKFTLHGTNEIK